MMDPSSRTSMDLTDKQWEIGVPLIPEPPRREDG